MTASGKYTILESGTVEVTIALDFTDYQSGDFRINGTTSIDSSSTGSAGTGRYKNQYTVNNDKDKVEYVFDSDISASAAAGAATAYTGSYTINDRQYTDLSGLLDGNLPWFKTGLKDPYAPTNLNRLTMNINGLAVTLENKTGRNSSWAYKNGVYYRESPVTPSSLQVHFVLTYPGYVYNPDGTKPWLTLTIPKAAGTYDWVRYASEFQLDPYQNLGELIRSQDNDAGMHYSRKYEAFLHDGQGVTKQSVSVAYDSARKLYSGTFSGNLYVGQNGGFKLQKAEGITGTFQFEYP